jgi:hypothetical protein
MKNAFVVLAYFERTKVNRFDRLRDEYLTTETEKYRGQKKRLGTKFSIPVDIWEGYTTIN